MKGGLGNIMKQAQQMQEGMQKAQEEIANMEVTGESGAGLVKITMTGKHDVKQVSIDPALLGDDKDMLEGDFPQFGYGYMQDFLIKLKEVIKEY